MLPRRLFNKAFVTVFRQRIAFFVPFVAYRRGKYAAATVLTGVTRLCRSFPSFCSFGFSLCRTAFGKAFPRFYRANGAGGGAFRHLLLALYAGARLCRTRFGATAFFIFDGKPCRAQPWRFCGIVFPRRILSAVRLCMRHKKSSYKSFKTIRSLCVILTVSIEIYELLILCAAKGVIFTFRKFFCVILFCTFCLFFALRFFPVFYCVFVGMLIVLLAKRRVKLPADCRFALSFAMPAAAVFCRALLPQRLFCPMFSPFKGTFARTAFFGVTNIYYVIRIYSPVQGCRLTIGEYCGSIQSQWITMLARRKFFTRGAKGEESDYHQTLR